MKHLFVLLLLTLPWVLLAQTRVDEPGLKALLAADKSGVVIDVLTAGEYADGNLPGARLRPFDATAAPSAPKFLPKT